MLTPRNFIKLGIISIMRRFDLPRAGFGESISTKDRKRARAQKEKDDFDGDWPYPNLSLQTIKNIMLVRQLFNVHP